MPPSDYMPSPLAIITSLLFVAVSMATAAEYFISPTGDDASAFTQRSPGHTIAAAAKRLQPGDQLTLLPGKYREDVELRNLNGTKAAPIRITAAPNAEVVLDGTRSIGAPWTEWKPGIYKTQIDFEVWQLFDQTTPFVAARYPNADWIDDSIFYREKSCLLMEEGSVPGRITCKKLTTSGIDLTGSIAVLHAGSWLSWAKPVLSHGLNADTFTFDNTKDRRGRPISGSAKRFLATDSKDFQRKSIKGKEGWFFFEGKQCLDAPGEWWFEQATKTIFVATRDGKPPLPNTIRGKVSTYALKVRDSSWIKIENLDFFATTFELNSSSNVTIDSCKLHYPSYNKFMLGELHRPAPTQLFNRSKDPSGIIIRRCEFGWMDGPVINAYMHGGLIEDCYMHHIDYTCLGSGGEGTVNLGKTKGLTFRRNTIHTAGNSEGIRVGVACLVEYNHVYNLNLIQHDGSLINVGVLQQEGTVLRRNWSHDSEKAALRFDTANMGDAATVRIGTGGEMSENVSWNCGPYKIKGDNHHVWGNTAITRPGTVGLAVLENANMGGVNKTTKTHHNLGVISSHFHRIRPNLPGTANNNVQFSAEQPAAAYLRNPQLLDFRLKEPTKYEGIGAYSKEESIYWIPGHRSSDASMPVPPNGSQAVPISTDLMFLAALDTTIHELRIAPIGADLDQATPVILKDGHNLHTPNCAAGITYQWRVDARIADGTTQQGTIWTFTTAPSKDTDKK